MIQPSITASVVQIDRETLTYTDKSTGSKREFVRLIVGLVVPGEGVINISLYGADETTELPFQPGDTVKVNLTSYDANNGQPTGKADLNSFTKIKK